MPARRMTKSTVDALAEAMGRGLPDTTACAVVKVSVETVRLWRKRGRAERAHIDAGGRAHPAERQYLKFLERMESARATGIEANLKLVQDHADDGDWKAARWLLTRFPEFRDSPPSRIRESMAAMLAAVDGADGMTPTAFLEAAKALTPETGEDVDAWAELVQAGYGLAKAELGLQQDRGELVSRGELDGYVRLLQAAWRDATGGHFDRDLEDFRAGELTAEDVRGRMDARIQRTLAAGSTPEGEHDGQQGSD